MQSTLLLIQFASQNIALFCCALFAGASTYVSLVEYPAMTEGGGELTGTYMLFAQPRPAFFQTSFAAIGSLAGISAGVAGATAWWLAGGLVLGIAALFHLFFVMPETRRLAEGAESGDPKAAGARSPGRLASLHALQSLAALAALFMFIMKF
jgi:hypothetical protein